MKQAARDYSSKINERVSSSVKVAFLFLQLPIVEISMVSKKGRF